MREVLVMKATTAEKTLQAKRAKWHKAMAARRGQAVERSLRCESTCLGIRHRRLELILWINLLPPLNCTDLLPSVDQSIGTFWQVILNHAMQFAKIVTGHRGVHVMLGVAGPEVVVMKPTKKAENGQEKTVEPFGLKDRVMPELVDRIDLKRPTGTVEIK